MKLILIAVVIATLSACWLRWTRGTRRARRPAAARATAFPYRAVSVCAGDTACHAVQQIEGERFLQRSAPPLPLPECDQQRCRCTYSHHEDRREAENRRADHGIDPALALPHTGPESRRGRGRRRGDYDG